MKVDELEKELQYIEVVDVLERLRVSGNQDDEPVC